MTALLIRHCRILFGTDGMCRQDEEAFYLNPVSGAESHFRDGKQMEVEAVRIGTDKMLEQRD